ncbi:MAG: hypothetical protein GX823_05815 [Clostridiales bacterium]|nr:hypothetical protein [Clostridiales bacterium]
MIEIRHKSAIPFYGAAAVWLLYALIFPLYRLPDFLIFLAAGLAAHFALSKIFPGTTELVTAPVETGNEDINRLLREGETAVAEMARIRDAISEKDIKPKIDALIAVTDKIFKDVLDDPSDYRQIRRFADFYLPTTMKLLHAYERFGRTGAAGENIEGTLKRIDAALDQILESYDKQYDALFQNQALDIETDIAVLEQMLKKEGLTGSDFK